MPANPFQRGNPFQNGRPMPFQQGPGQIHPQQMRQWQQSGGAANGQSPQQQAQFLSQQGITPQIAQQLIHQNQLQMRQGGSQGGQPGGAPMRPQMQPPQQNSFQDTEGFDEEEWLRRLLSQSPLSQFGA